MVFQSPEPQNLDLSEDEELATAMDYHSMIIQNHHHEDSDHIVTADEVISELEIMMEVVRKLYSNFLNYLEKDFLRAEVFLKVNILDKTTNYMYQKSCKGLKSKKLPLIEIL